MIDLSKSWRTCLKNGVPGVPRVLSIKNNDTSTSCIDAIRNTNEKRRCSTCSAGTPRTRREPAGVPACSGVTYCKSVKKCTRNTKNTKNTGKQACPPAFQEITGCKAYPREGLCPQEWCDRNRGEWCKGARCDYRSETGAGGNWRN